MNEYEEPRKRCVSPDFAAFGVGTPAVYPERRS